MKLKVIIDFVLFILLALVSVAYMYLVVTERSALFGACSIINMFASGMWFANGLYDFNFWED